MLCNELLKRQLLQRPHSLQKRINQSYLTNNRYQQPCALGSAEQVCGFSGSSDHPGRRAIWGQRPMDAYSSILAPLSGNKFLGGHFTTWNEGLPCSWEECAMTT